MTRKSGLVNQKIVDTGGCLATGSLAVKRIRSSSQELRSDFRKCLFFDLSFSLPTFQGFSCLLIYLVGSFSVSGSIIAFPSSVSEKEL